MSFVYTPFKAKLLKGEVDLDLPQDIRIMLIKLKASTTTDTEQDTEFISSFTTLGELVATNYVRKALAGEVVNQDDPNNRGEFDANDVTFTTLGGAANDTIGAILLFRFVTNDADSIPIAYIDNAGADFSQATNGSDITIAWDVEGILQAT